LSDDVRRYLNNEPIQARPPSTLYELRKFASRKRGVVIASALFAIAVVVGGIGTAWQAYATRQESKKLRASLEFLHEMLRSPDPLALGRDAKVIDMLDRAATHAETKFAGVPMVAASIRHAFARTYEALGLYENAETHARFAVETYNRELGSNDRETLDAVGFLALVLHDQGKLEEAESLYRTALNGLRKVSGPNDRETLTTEHNLALLHQHKGDLNGAEHLFRQILATQRNTIGEEHEDTLTTLNSLAVLLRDMDKLAEAESLQRAVVAGRKSVLGDQHPDTHCCLHNLAVLLMDQNKLGWIKTNWMTLSRSLTMSCALDAPFWGRVTHRRWNP
jgi:tetratricopeptide (TPR) repeat protein